MHGTSFFKRLKMRVTIKPTDQINKASKSNYSPNRSGIQFMFMVLTKPKLTTNGRSVKYQRVEDFV